jgi:hypothetical protein
MKNTLKLGIATLIATLLFFVGTALAHSSNPFDQHEEGHSTEAEHDDHDDDDHGSHDHHGDEDQPVPELAEHMTVLSTLTHKLGLSIEAKNPKMTQFYTVESIVKAREIQEIIPEYEGKPVADLMSSIMMAGYYELTRNMRKKPVDFEKIEKSYDALIARCNACHVATDFGYLKIKRNSSNPYMLDFTYREE